MRKWRWMLALALGLLAACAGRTANEPEVAAVDESQAAQPEETTRSACKRGGCSGELCVSVDAEPVRTACQWQAHYACYDSAECALQADGPCAWTETEELKQCLEDASRKQGDLGRELK